MALLPHCIVANFFYKFFANFFFLPISQKTCAREQLAYESLQQISFLLFGGAVVLYSRVNANTFSTRTLLELKSCRIEENFGRCLPPKSLPRK